jgi:hypothetical protein
MYLNTCKIIKFLKIPNHDTLDHCLSPSKYQSLLALNS